MVGKAGHDETLSQHPMDFSLPKTLKTIVVSSSSFIFRCDQSFGVIPNIIIKLAQLSKNERGEPGKFLFKTTLDGRATQLHTNDHLWEAVRRYKQQ